MGSGLGKRMNSFLRKESKLDELRKEARNSVVVLHRALSEVSRETGTSDVDAEAVKARIKQIIELQKEPA
jgi:hypothetical protein